MTGLASMAVALATLVAVAALGYLVAASVAMRRFLERTRREVPTGPTPGVTVLKPLYGLDPELEDNLRAFCQQDDAPLQIVFGVRDADDPAIPVVERVIADHPHLDLELVVDARLSGTNYKVSNLVNMSPRIRHDIVLIADSDMRPAPGYLARVLAPFRDPEVGAVTCLYAGSAGPASGRASRLATVLGAMFINDWFAPSVRVSLALRPAAFCLGATMAVRREVLDALGGFETLADDLADDYQLGRHVRDAGHRIVVADTVIENVMVEPDLRSLLAHELRWGRTMRAMEPTGFVGAVLTDALPLTCVTALVVLGCGGGALLALLPLGCALALRVAAHVHTARALAVRQGPTPWLIPLRDWLTLAVRVASLFPGRVAWRGHSFGLDPAGRLHSPRDASSGLPNRTEHHRAPAS